MMGSHAHRPRRGQRCFPMTSGWSVLPSPGLDADEPATLAPRHGSLGGDHLNTSVRLHQALTDRIVAMPGGHILYLFADARGRTSVRLKVTTVNAIAVHNEAVVTSLSRWRPALRPLLSIAQEPWLRMHTV